MKAILFVLTIVFSLIGREDLLAQASQDSVSQDSAVIIEATEKEKKGSIFSGRPGKSLLLSLVIPGAGQIYNKSYLRVPFVWGAVGGTGWLLVHNTKQYRCYRDAYINLIDGTTFEPPNDCCDKNIPLITDPARMRLKRDEANKNMQISILVFSAAWLLNGIDAFVDAHLKDFDINEDLTIDFGSKFDDDPYSPMRMGIYVSF